MSPLRGLWGVPDLQNSEEELSSRNLNYEGNNYQ
jgi:hypothetical protein